MVVAVVIACLSCQKLRRCFDPLECSTGLWSVSRYSPGVATEEFDERFTRLDPTLWTASYLPAWSSRFAAAATLVTGPGGLDLSIPPTQPLWCPDLHDGPLRVSAIQSANRSGPVGSTDAPQPFRDGLVVRGAAHSAGLRAALRRHRRHLLGTSESAVDVLGVDGQARGRARPVRRDLPDGDLRRHGKRWPCRCGAGYPPVPGSCAARRLLGRAARHRHRAVPYLPRCTGGPARSTSPSTGSPPAPRIRRPTTRCSSFWVFDFPDRPVSHGCPHLRVTRVTGTHSRRPRACAKCHDFAAGRGQTRTLAERTLDARGEAGALVDGPFGVQFGRDVRAADHVRRDTAARSRRRGHAPIPGLRRSRRCRRRGAAGRVGSPKLMCRPRRRCARSSPRRAAARPCSSARPGAPSREVLPSRGPARPCRCSRYTSRAAGAGSGVVSAPAAALRAGSVTPHSGFHSFRSSVGERVGGQELADVDADAARADHRDRSCRRACRRTPRHRRAPSGGRCRGWPESAGRRRSRAPPRRTRQLVAVDAGAQAERRRRLVEHRRVVADRLGELLLAGDPAGDAELAADLGVRLEQRDAVAALGGRDRRGQPGGSGADDGDALRAPGRRRAPARSRGRHGDSAGTTRSCGRRRGPGRPGCRRCRC